MNISFFVRFSRCATKKNHIFINSIQEKAFNNKGEKMKRIVIKTGEYQKDGETKGEYVNLGVMMDGDNGPYMLLDPTVNLAGCLTKQNMLNHQKGKKTGSSVMVSVFDSDRNKSANNAPQPANNAPSDDSFSDDIPF